MMNETGVIATLGLGIVFILSMYLSAVGGFAVFKNLVLKFRRYGTLLVIWMITYLIIKYAKHGEHARAISNLPVLGKLYKIYDGYASWAVNMGYLGMKKIADIFGWIGRAVFGMQGDEKFFSLSIGLSGYALGFLLFIVIEYFLLCPIGLPFLVIDFGDRFKSDAYM